MIIETMMIIQIKYADYELKTLIEKAKTSEERKAEKYRNKSDYVNPCVIRLGVINKGNVFYKAIRMDYSPV